MRKYIQVAFDVAVTLESIAHLEDKKDRAEAEQVEGLARIAALVIIRDMHSEITETIAEYLEAIYNMLDEGKLVIAARVADRMDVSRPTVSATLRRMVSQDLIAIDDDNQITLTAHGLSVANEHIRRHRLAERFLTDMLGLEWHLVHAEAHAFEHGLSPLVEEKLLALLGQPATCPHGNPIPGVGAGGLPADALTLDQVSTGQRVRLLRITEEGERDLDLLRNLQGSGIVPGAPLDICRETPDGPIHAKGERATLTLPPRKARTLWVAPVG